RNLAVVAGLYDNIFKLACVVEASADVDCILKGCSGWCWRHADLAGGDLLALLLEGLSDVLRDQTANLHLVRIEPDPHRILARAKDRDVTHARQSRQFVLQSDCSVVRE